MSIVVIAGTEERQPLDVIPVQVRQQDRAVEKPRAKQCVTERIPGAGVEDQSGRGRVVVGYRHAGGMPAVAQKVGAGRGVEPRPRRDDSHGSSPARASWEASPPDDDPRTARAVPHVRAALGLDGGNPASSDRRPASRSSTTFQMRPLTKHGTRPVLGKSLPVVLDAQHPVEQQEHLGPGLALPDNVVPAFTLVIVWLRPTTHDLLGEPALSAVSTAVTRAFDSLVAPGRVAAERLAIPVLEVRRPDLCESWPSLSYTQWRGKRLAPSILPSARPSARW